MESWKPIENFETTYLVSDFGNIKSVRKNIILKTQVTNSGYELVHLRVLGKRKAYTVHRLVANAFIVNQLNKPQVNHKDGVKTNNISHNLEWVTSVENMAHATVNDLLINHTELRKKLMKNIGSEFGFENSQMYLKKATPLFVHPSTGGDKVYFRSGRNASKELNLDHKTILKKIDTGKPYKGYLFTSK